MVPSHKRRFTLAAACLLIALAIWLPWHLSRQPGDAERRLADALAWMAAHPPKIRDRDQPDANQEARQREAVSLAAERWYRELLEQYPEFKPEFKDVPDDQNGFLQLLALIEEIGSDPVIPDDLREMLKGESSWDPERFLAWRSENQDLFDRLLQIAELPDQSIKGIEIERYHYLNPRLVVDFNLLLSAAGRAASDDPEAALRFAKASMGLARHYDGIELPTLLAKTVSILVRLNTQEHFTTHILPTIAGDPEALASWRGVLAFQNPLASEAPNLMKAEWNITMRQWILPALLTGDAPANFGSEHGSLRIPDPEEFIAAYTDQLRTIGQSGASLPEIEFFTGPGIEPQTQSQLSQGSQELLATLYIGSNAWFKGMLQSNSRAAMSDAALAVLLGREPPAEPLTGRPFLWDPSTRILSPPGETTDLGIALEPLTLP